MTFPFESTKDIEQYDPFLQPDIPLPDGDIPTAITTVAETYARMFLEDLEADGDGISTRSSFTFGASTPPLKKNVT